ncbi:MAG TPA: hypothetical protein VEF04_21380, partial [Blastocatellia bacterium]|nr:hypothetical protein [Blastocatellia bacterium]
LVLHDGVHMDHGVISTKLTVSKIDPSKVINVFTMPDLLDANAPDSARARLNDYMEKTSYPRFVVYGCHEGDDATEVDYLRSLSIFTTTRDGLTLGAGALGTYLEQRIGEHVSAILPHLKQQLITQQEIARAWLEANGVVEPSQIMQKLGSDMRDNWPSDAHEMSMRSLRKCAPLFAVVVCVR